MTIYSHEIFARYKEARFSALNDKKQQEIKQQIGHNLPSVKREYKHCCFKLS